MNNGTLVLARRGYARFLVASLVVALASTSAGYVSAQGRTDEPLQPPQDVPRSRLLVTPSEFEAWLARTDRVVAPPTGTPAPQIVSPPPPPAVVTPVPPPPPLARPQAPVPDAAPPGPPVLTGPPQAPVVATLPPDSPDTTAPSEPAPTAGRPLAPVRVEFEHDTVELPDSAHSKLDSVATWLRDHPDVRIRIVGYASEASQVGSEARRRSLARVVAVRNYLVARGILSTRMDVQALGDQAPDAPRDRVEVIIPGS